MLSQEDIQERESGIILHWCLLWGWRGMSQRSAKHKDMEVKEADKKIRRLHHRQGARSQTMLKVLDKEGDVLQTGGGRSLPRTWVHLRC